MSGGPGPRRWLWSEAGHLGLQSRRLAGMLRLPWFLLPGNDAELHRGGIPVPAAGLGLGPLRRASPGCAGKRQRFRCSALCPGGQRALCRGLRCAAAAQPGGARSCPAEVAGSLGSNFKGASLRLAHWFLEPRTPPLPFWSTIAMPEPGHGRRSQ